MKELSTHTGYGSCKACGERKVKICKKVYTDGSMHFVDEHNKSWNSSTCPSCYVARRKLKRRVQKPDSVSCKECSLEFKPKLSKQKFCSDKCRKKHNNDLRVLVKNEENPELEQGLIKGLEEALAHSRGEETLKTSVYEDDGVLLGGEWENPHSGSPFESVLEDDKDFLEQTLVERDSTLETAKKVLKTHAGTFKKLKDTGD